MASSSSSSNPAAAAAASTEAVAGYERTTTALAVVLGLSLLANVIFAAFGLRKHRWRVAQDRMYPKGFSGPRRSSRSASDAGHQTKANGNSISRVSSLRMREKAPSRSLGERLTSSFIGRGKGNADGDDLGPHPWEIKIKELKQGVEIGRGSYGKVFHGTWVGLPVAIKRPHEGNLADPVAMDRFLYEVEIMTKLHHPNIVQFLGACITEPDICLVLEYLELGNLHDLTMSRPQEFSTLRVHKCAVDIARGMCYLHRRCHLIQRDLKTRNIMCDEHLTCKVGDFGLSKVLAEDSPAVKKTGSFLVQMVRDPDPSPPGSRTKVNPTGGGSDKGSGNIQGSPSQSSGGTWTRMGAGASGSLRMFREHDLSAVGTPAFTAPEVIRCEKYSQAADVYSFGVIIAELITKEEAYSDLKKKISPMELAYQVAHEGRRPEIQSGLIPQSYIDLLQQCWLDKPTDRPSFRRILETLHDTTQDFLPPPKLSASSGAPATPSSSFLQSGVAKQESKSGGGGGPKIDASREVAESPFGKALASSLESMSEHSVQIQSVGSASGSGAMRMTEGER